MNTLVDYVKVRFDLDGEFSVKDSRWEGLFSILRVDPSKFGDDVGGSGYEARKTMDEGLDFFYGGYYTSTASGQRTCLLEMKGHACRMFEERILGECLGRTDDEKDRAILDGWKFFLYEIFKQGGHCTRLDLPTDDFSGLVPFEELKEKLAGRCYKSSMRAFSEVPGFPVDSSECEPAFVHVSKGGGYSATLGTRESVQLCIYNKKAEREAHGFGVKVDSWIRYEVRYYHDQADAALAAFMFSFGVDMKVRERAKGKGSSFSGDVAKGNYEVCGPARFIVGCLRGLFCPLERKVANKNVTRDAVVWAPWERFVSSFVGKYVYSGARPEMTVTTNARWLDFDTSSAMVRVFASRPEMGLDCIRYILNSGISKLDEGDLAIVNNYRLSQGLRPYASVKELVSVVSNGGNGVDVLAGVPGVVCALFGKDGLRLGSARYSYLGYEDDEVPRKGGGGDK